MAWLAASGLATAIVLKRFIAGPPVLLATVYYRRVRRTSLLSAGILLVLGVLALVEALRLRDDWLGAKLMPAVVGLVLIVLGAAHLVRPAATPEWPDAAGFRRVALIFVVLALYVAVLPYVGFLPATAAFVLVLVRALGAFSWAATIGVTVAIALASHLVFIYWLGMSLT
ncbi:MAG: hypothetical protein DMD90_27265 [Candidatus Rokuibacteriota bacterium]|nr:MAG: hypothetical protein DMD90_27265 [Candidatus Rokubacteria bacterium]